MRLEIEQAVDTTADPLALHVMRGELERTESALRRLARGAYGLCEACGAPIDRRRLQVLPSAAHCTGCSAKLKAVRPNH
jgi:RNA polymerase-binding transcription factor DksA